MRSWLFLASALLGGSTASLVKHLNPDATSRALKWQPVMDFDKDVCMHTAAIGSDGTLNSGSTEMAECDNQDRLARSNVYSRQRCNRGWCAFMYGYYAEYDSGGTFGIENHRHDWEHAIVWTKDDEFVWAYWSAHGGYKRGWKTNVRLLGGTHPKLVYHHGGARSASIRDATADDEHIENPLGHWFRGNLLSRETIDRKLWDKVSSNKIWGSAHPDFGDDRFTQTLVDNMPEDAKKEGFDCAYDEPGYDH